MHFGFALDLPHIDLWNIDLLDTHLNFLDTNIPSKHFFCLQDVFKMSSRRLGRRKVVTLKTYWTHVMKTSSGSLEDQQMFAGI